MSTKHTQGPWSQGITLNTAQTQRWSDAERAANNEIEKRMVFAGFSPFDEGRSRRRIAVCETKEDARLIAAAPDLLLAAQFIVDCSNPMSPQQEECWIALRAAIAKATGEKS